MKNRTLIMTLAVLVLLPFGVAAEEGFNYNYFDVTYLDNGMEGTVTAVEDRETIGVSIGDGGGAAIRVSLAMSDRIHVFAGFSGSNMDLKATQTVPYPTVDEMAAAFFTTGTHPNWDAFCDLDGDGSVNFRDLAILAEGDRVAAEAAVDGDLTSYRLGVGYNKMIRPKVGVFAQLFLDLRDLDHGSAAFVGGDRDFGASESGIGAALGLQVKATARLELEGRVTYSPVGDINMLGATDAEMLQDQTLIGIGAEYWVTDRISFFADFEGDGDIQTWAVGGRTMFGS